MWKMRVDPRHHMKRQGSGRSKRKRKLGAEEGTSVEQREINKSVRIMVTLVSRHC